MRVKAKLALVGIALLTALPFAAVADGRCTATLNVAPLSDNASELYIAGTAAPGEDSTSSRVVQAVMRVCAEMGKNCELAR